MSDIIVCALYKFVRLENFELLRAPLLAVMHEYRVRGTLLLAEEGINGTISGNRSGIEAVLAWLQQDPRLQPLDFKESTHEQLPFHRAKVKLKREIVTMGVEGIDPNRTVGTYVRPEDWNALIADPEVLLVDTRNRYEVEIGTFEGAVNPGLDSFREFPDYVRNNLDPAKYKKVAMFCTGGIRCEKSTAYLKEQGFDEVYHLQGGILNYLEQVPEQESRWRGECFVFDDRVAVDHALKKGRYEQCHACRFPITRADMSSEHYVRGVSCPRCHDKISNEKKTRLQQREKQVQLARTRGEEHIGADAAAITRVRKLRKRQQREAQRQTDRDKQSTA